MDIQWGAAGVAGAALIALVCLGVGAAARAPVAAASVSPPAGAQKAAARAASYLARAQNRDGGFGLAPAEPSTQLASAWVVIGLAAAGRNPAALRRDGHSPVAWIREHLDQLQGPGDLERTILALAAARAPLGTLVAQLRRDQLRNGSFADQANLTAFAILALRAAHAGGLTAPAAWLARQQNPGGGFSFAQRGDPGDVDDTAGAVEALVAASAPRRLVVSAIGYIERQENPDGGFPLQRGGDSNAQSTAWAIQALAAAGVSAAPALSYLEVRLTAAGAVDYEAGDASTPVWVTAESLAAFAGAPLPVTPSA
jgi:hypothetical protein